jgi:hypothetical protein
MSTSEIPQLKNEPTPNALPIDNVSVYGEPNENHVRV